MLCFHTLDTSVVVGGCAVALSECLQSTAEGHQYNISCKVQALNYAIHEIDKGRAWSHVIKTILEGLS